MRGTHPAAGAFRTRGQVRRLPNSASKTPATTAALTIGIGLVTVIAIAAASASTSVASATQRSFTSDLIVTPDSFLGLSPQVAEDIDALAELTERARAHDSDQAGGLIFKGRYALVREDYDLPSACDP